MCISQLSQENHCFCWGKFVCTVKSGYVELTLINQDLPFRGRLQARDSTAPPAQRPADPHRQRDPGLGQRSGQPRPGRGRPQPR